MTTPTPYQEDAFDGFAPREPAAPDSSLPTPPIDPNNPPWTVGAAFFVWLSSVALLLVVQLLAVLPYAFYKYRGASPEQLSTAVSTDPTLIFISVASVVVAHLLTLVVVWAIVTNFGRRPFWQTLGWTWSERFGFWTSTLLAVGLLALGFALTRLFGDVKTPFDEMLLSSPAARLATAFLATATAPLVEELVYRGILYPALQRIMGMLGAVLLVGSLFTIVHVAQYYNNPAVIAAVGMLGFVLTLVRARTGRLLPCFVIHLVFNGIQCVGLVLDFIIGLFRPHESSTQTSGQGFHSLVEGVQGFALWLF